MQEADETTLATGGVVQVWFATPGFPVDAATPEVAQQLEILSSQERERYSAFKFDTDRIHYLAAHAMLRQVLSQFANRAPQDLQFSCNQYGKPFLEERRSGSSIEFNLTHTDGMVACALSRHPVGLDAERITDKIGLEIAPSVLAPSELIDLERTLESKRHHRLLEFWTLKEAFIKATGKGLSQPLDRFWFDLDKQGEPTISFSPDEPYESDHWRFAQLKDASTSHELAIAVALPPRQKLSVCLKRFVWGARNYSKSDDLMN